ncbi:AAEL010720-PA, partial [Aedes aegypti]
CRSATACCSCHQSGNRGSIEGIQRRQPDDGRRCSSRTSGLNQG